MSEDILVAKCSRIRKGTSEEEGRAKLGTSPCKWIPRICLAYSFPHLTDAFIEISILTQNFE